LFNNYAFMWSGRSGINPIAFLVLAGLFLRGTPEGLTLTLSRAFTGIITPICIPCLAVSWRFARYTRNHVSLAVRASQDGEPFVEFPVKQTCEEKKEYVRKPDHQNIFLNMKNKLGFIFWWSGGRFTGSTRGSPPCDALTAGFM